MNPKLAKGELVQWRAAIADDASVSHEALDRLKKLPKKLRELALTIAEECSASRLSKDGAKSLDALAPKDRRRLFVALAGPVGRDIDIAWQAVLHAGQSDDLLRFRAPRTPEWSRTERTRWLARLLAAILPFQSEVVTTAWLATWAPYIFPDYRSREPEIGRLCAAVIDSGGKAGEEVFDVLCQSARGEHPIGAMGHHVTTGLLTAANQAGWDLMKGMLRAAQRQEGLRQSILEALGTANPEAFRQFLQVLVDDKLIRFAAVVQACDSWFSLQWAAQKANPLESVVARVLSYLEAPKARAAALTGAEPEDAYLALWTLACENVVTSVAPAEKLLQHENPGTRFVAALHLASLEHPAAQAARVTALADDDPQVALAAMSGWDDEEWGTLALLGEDAFDALLALKERLPKKQTTLKPLVWPWTTRKISSQSVGAFLVRAADRDVGKLIPHLKDVDSWTRSALCRRTEEQESWSADETALMLHFLADASPDVRHITHRALLHKGVDEEELPRLELLLKRKSAETRNGLTALIFKMSDPAALESALRLLAAKNAPQRLGGLELLRQLAEAKRCADDCRRQATAWATRAKKLSKEEQLQLDAILASESPAASLGDALGFADPQGRSEPLTAEEHDVQTVTPASLELLRSLDSLVHQHREEQITCRNYSGPVEHLLGTAEHSFPSPSTHRPVNPQLDSLPLRALWEEWNAKRPEKLRDRDGCELLRATLLLETDRWTLEETKSWLKEDKARKPAAALLLEAQKAQNLRYAPVARAILLWLLRIDHTPAHFDFLLDTVETLLARVSGATLEATKVAKETGWGEVPPDFRNLRIVEFWLKRMEQLARNPDARFTKPQHHRYWRLLQRIDQPAIGSTRLRCSTTDLALAYRAGAATRDDVAEHLLGPRVSAGSYAEDFISLRILTDRRRSGAAREFAAIPEIRDLLQRITHRTLELEFARGEKPTVSTNAALSLGDVGGMDVLLQLLRSLADKGLKGSNHSASPSSSKAATLTQVIKSTWPREGDTIDSFRQTMRTALREGAITEQMLVELAFLAPQWVEFLEPALGWDGLSEAIYWFLAHMNYVYGLHDAFADDADLEADKENENEGRDLSGSDAPKRLTRWERIIAERTSLTAAERDDGAIDTAWFHRVFAALGAKRWDGLAGSTRLVASGAQAKRARLIGDVLRGEATKKEIVDGIRKKHLKENVRLLGLLPLAKGSKAAPDLAERYEELQRYHKYAQGLGSMTKPEALRAVEIGLHNLAGTAGYPDPLRLSWAMEASSTADLAAGPVAVHKGDVTYTLALDEEASPELTIRRKEKILKALPKEVKKDAKFVALRERGNHLKQQATRLKQSLELAMCRGDAFSGAELMQLADHALLWPQLSRLVLVGEGIKGYPDKRGKALRDHAGDLEPVRKKESFRIAHPHDLYCGNDWAAWQQECLLAERLQPFKQVFRELYVATSQEKKDKKFSRRYAGQQVEDRRSRALWGRRDWATDEYGSIFKAFLAEGVVADVSFNDGITTPLEYEGLTIENVHFTTTQDGRALPISKVPPRLFSEVMRDMDLVVSVAHTGEVDPEASASTVEMRARLLQETCLLLSLKNVRIKTKEARAMIKGKLGEYTVHLGSGTVHRMPGGSVCIVPVHAQHRGRVFLPFADDDPRTAEVISKTLLLAKDHQIEDPLILEQLRGMA